MLGLDQKTTSRRRIAREDLDGSEAYLRIIEEAPALGDPGEEPGLETMITMITTIIRKHVVSFTGLNPHKLCGFIMVYECL